MKHRVEQVVIVGADAPAWMAGAAIQASLGGASVRVRVIELPSLLQPVDVYSVLPALAGFHRRLGIDERLLFSVCKALPIMGQRFSNWSGAGAPFIHGYDWPSPRGAGFGFTQLWIRGRQEGLRAGFENFSLGAMAAKAGRVPTPVENAELSATFGYNIDATSYSALLRHLAIRAGVEPKAAMVSDVEVQGDRITGITLADGERVEADLFVDASGPQAILIGRMAGAELESAREWLPCDRMLIASGKGLQPHPGFSQITAFRQGWVGLFPLKDRTAVTAAYDSREISDQTMLDRLPILASLPISGDCVVSNLTNAIRKRAWVGNCVAVGESAFSLEPLDAVQLHIAHHCISQLMSLFPVAADDFLEAEIYNRIICRAATNVRDFQAAHYKLNRRFDEPLWDRCRDVPAGQTLERKLEVFSARGRVPLYDDESFSEEDWESLFIGHGLIPQSHDPRVDAIPEQELIATVQNRLQTIAELVASMPAVDEFLSRAFAEESREALGG